MWNEFEFVSDFTARTFIQYFFNQSGEVQGKGAESGTDRPTNHAITDSEVIIKMRDAYLAKALANPSNDPVAPEAIRHHYDGINATLRNIEKQRIDAEPKHLEAIQRFAERAYRRPMTGKRNGRICLRSIRNSGRRIRSRTKTRFGIPW